MSEDEAEQLLEILKDKHALLYIIALVSLYGGLRAGEIINREWKDLNFAESMILIRDSKNGLSRHAFMTKQVKKELRELKIQLSVIDTAQEVEDVDLPGFRLHKLKGSRADLWSITVNGNWRLTFEFRDGNSYILNYEDYH
ncbi:type II toxin-antitoxin system RelE/ParE family toxin [Maridesulfovibrio ferrireducens]|uniref:type II toxin-antitoxin system RelE/ParE family toxin n=1 Tax=Maridesulfovibrio ferrireducens TaxID=246191 RepID=UPI00147C643F|nr:type II toxin-antitoxin system RelE/ParE family toxin [Maridesulfovibrio ferrireducens]